VRPPFQYTTRVTSQRLADLQNETMELERRLSDARASLDRELWQLAAEHTTLGRDGDRGDPWAAYEHGAVSGEELPAEDSSGWADGEGYAGWDVSPGAGAGPAGNGTGAWNGGNAHAGADEWQLPETEEPGAAGEPAAGRTQALVDGGRHNAYHPRFSFRRKAAIGAAAAAALIAIIVIMLSGGGVGWPPSVATVQREVILACENHDVKAEPSQVDFACAKASRQVLWIFALMTSLNNPRFHDAATGRVGLEPITPALGGQIAWSLNLHHPYNPADPIDSLQVAARAINNIIGGATLTGPHGNLVVQSGLEGDSARCARYTGSAAVISQQGFPDMCAKPLIRPVGEAALVSDVYRKWIVGASPEAARTAAVLFENAANPGNAQVQAILKQVLKGKWAA
jgi:hypothetical protein